MLLEALRRAVDIRDTSAQRIALRARPLFLVDVLNALCESMNVDSSDLTSGTDLIFGTPVDSLMPMTKRRSGTVTIRGEAIPAKLGGFC